MKGIKELIYYFYKKEVISWEELDCLQKKGYIESSDVKELSAEGRKKKKRKIVQPTEEENLKCN